ncbi:hypothetical protein FGO68_gene4729 [Halteria grandinella]|uniref:Uncharacterized protein n=1 Tax=Halteria grandinella TaxID=5974 RepID=A0A8J8NA09_HALGN|nr:hypothetical protein FGO68_gene4729 [Halteria grandinella]
MMTLDIANVFLPSQKGTKLGFMRDILSETKLSLRSNEVNHMKVPLYQEISVKNLYNDAMTDPVLKKYLPEPDQLSGKLPERDFFFGILCTLKNQYMKDVINEANEKRFKADKDGEKKEAIRLSDAWLDELMKHPYHSRKNLALILIGKPGTGVYLLRESAKVSKEIKDRKLFKLSKRLGLEEEKEDGNLAGPGGADKRKKGNDGRPVQANSSAPEKMQISAPGK